MKNVTEFVLILICCLAVFGVVQNTSAGEQVCYEAYGAPIEAEYESGSLLITVNWYDTEAEVSEAIGIEETSAYSECEVYADRDIGWCEIWVARPVSVLGDPNMDSLGHEVLHGLWGDFHE